jgi:hypothetical protein
LVVIHGYHISDYWWLFYWFSRAIKIIAPNYENDNIFIDC